MEEHPRLTRKQHALAKEMAAQIRHEYVTDLELWERLCWYISRDCKYGTLPLYSIPIQYVPLLSLTGRAARQAWSKQCILPVYFNRSTVAFNKDVRLPRGWRCHKDWEHRLWLIDHQDAAQLAVQQQQTIVRWEQRLATMKKKYVQLEDLEGQLHVLCDKCSWRKPVFFLPHNDDPDHVATMQMAAGQEVIVMPVNMKDAVAIDWPLHWHTTDCEIVRLSQCIADQQQLTGLV